MPPDANQAHGLGAAPASSRTARRSLVDAPRGAGLVRRRAAERPRGIRVVRCIWRGGHVGRVDRQVPLHAARAHGPGAAPASSRTTVDRSSTPRRAQVSCVSVLPNGSIVSGSYDSTLKVWEDVEGKMARLVAQHRLHEMNVKTAGRLIAAFL